MNTSNISKGQFVHLLIIQIRKGSESKPWIQTFPHFMKGLNQTLHLRLISTHTDICFPN